MNENINKPDIIDKIIISQEEIKEINKRIYSEIFSYYKNNIKNYSKIINVIVILEGAKNFYEDLFTKKVSTNELHDPHFNIFFIRAESYEGTESGKEVFIDFGDIGPEINITDKHILIIDDIYDSGKTLYSIVEKIKKYNPKSLECCVLIERNIEHKKEIDIRFVGKKIDEQEFLIGYGLDYNGEYRELPYVGTMKKKIKMDNKDNLKECQNEIKRLKEERKKDYKKLVKQYEIAEKNLKNNPKLYGEKEKIKGFIQGLISGMVLLNDNLKSKIID